MIWLLIVVTVLVSAWGFRDVRVIERSMLMRANSYSLLTYGFVHSDWRHLMFNMITLGVFGMHTDYGWLIYLSGIVVSGVPSWLGYRICIGASGGTLALLFAWLAQNLSLGTASISVLLAGYHAWSRHPVHFWGALHGWLTTVIVTVIVAATGYGGTH